ncbi:MAG: hypothetical protein ABIO92_02245, partial [Chloroflexia bacterium]
MLFANQKIPHSGRIVAMTFAALLLTLLTGSALGGCGGVTGVAPSSSNQSQTPQFDSNSPTPPLLPTEQPTIPPPLPHPEQTAPIIPTPAPTLPPTLPPPPPTFTPYPTFTPLPTPTPAVPILLTDPVAEPKEHGNGHEWFASTGHAIRGTFLEYWKNNGEASQFGYPLTEEFVEVTSADPDNKQLKYQSIQYFEHALFTSQANPPKNEEKVTEVQAQTPTAVQTRVNVEVQSGISGKQMLQQNGYATGRYPLYGYASDFSWLSGKMDFHMEPTCL